MRKGFLAVLCPFKGCVFLSSDVAIIYVAAAECIDAVEIRTCNAKVLTHVKVNAKKCIQSKYIVIGNSHSLDGSSETSAESAQSITSVLQVDQTFPRQDLSQTQPALPQKQNSGGNDTLESQRQCMN